MTSRSTCCTSAVESVIGAYLLDTEDGPALFDCGPTSRVADAEGAAGRARPVAHRRAAPAALAHPPRPRGRGRRPRPRAPRAAVHVSEIGAPHLVDPSRLEQSARRLYGEHFDELWGELAPVPEESIRVAGGRVLGLDCFPTPGHASHHVCYLAATGRSTRATRPACASSRASSSSRPRRRRSSTATPGSRRSTRSSGARPSGSRSSTSASPTTSSGTSATCAGASRSGRRQSPAAPSRTPSSPSARRRSPRSRPDQRASYAQALPFWQSYAGIKRWADKRRERAA